MSMNGSFRSIAPGVLDRLLADPGLTELVLAYSASAPAVPPLDEAYLATLPAGFREGIAAMSRKLQDSTGQAAARKLAAQGIDVAELDEELCIQKAWMGVHRLLAGDDWHPKAAPANAVLGGVEFGSEGGYGKARYLTTEETKAVAAALAALDADELANQLDPAAFEDAEVYPGGWDEPEAVAWLADSIRELQAYHQAAAKADRAMLLWIS